MRGATAHRPPEGVPVSWGREPWPGGPLVPACRHKGLIIKALQSLSYSAKRGWFWHCGPVVEEVMGWGNKGGSSGERAFLPGVAIWVAGGRRRPRRDFWSVPAKAGLPALRWWRLKIKGLCALGKACHWSVAHTFWFLARCCRRKCTRPLELTLPSKKPPPSSKLREFRARHAASR